MKIVSESLNLMNTAFGLVAALAWNEAVKKLIEAYVPKGKGDVLSSFIYAVVITIVAVIIASRLVKIKSRLENNQELKD